MNSFAEPAADETFSESLAFADLLLWSSDRPTWQRDALRRIAQKGVLSSGDIDELLGLCLDPSLTHEVISQAHVSAQATVGDPIAILRIENPTGINALASDQKLEFAKDGLTVIYGDNGSGKSGYVRVLKHACRTRDRGTKILRDVEATTTTQQSANIVFSRGMIEDSFAWNPDLPGHDELPSVSIFDSRSANVHVEKTNAVAYIPFPMQVLEALATACDQVKAKLDTQLQEIASKTPLALKAPQLSADTAAGAFVRSLSAKSNIAQLDLLAALSDVESRRLTTLEADLAQDPKRGAALISNQKTRVDNGAAQLRKICEATSKAAFYARDTQRADRDAKATAAKLASEALFAASPLPEVGLAVWRSLWEAARKYSDGVAYPDRKFPDFVGKDELCVLCQQPLEQPAIDRRNTFENFLRGSTKADEESAEKAYGETLSKALACKMTMQAMHQFKSVIATEVGDPVLAAQVRACGVQAAWRLRAFTRGLTECGEEPELPQAALATLSTDLANRAAQLSADQNSPAHVALIKECRELKERQALGPLLADLKAEIARLKEAERIITASKDTAKRAITTKNKDLSDKLVTNALRGRFAREIDKLKLARMPVELRKVKDQNAVSYFQVCLVERPEEPVGDIFSEGEHRCVALAAFLAELVTSKQYSSIVFDDPMSSLDHIHRKAVAARLVEEATHRQVIVFTHDLTFLFELRREAESKSRPIAYQTVCRKQSRPGYVDAELPMKAKSAQQLAHSLRSELKQAKSQFDTWPDAKRTIFCKGMIEQLRESWDQGIADFVFPVLGRFDNTIKGNSLFKLAVIDDDDVKTVTAARGRLSEEMHTSAETLNPQTISHAALLSEVVKLEEWLASIAKRQRDVKAPVTSYA